MIPDLYEAMDVISRELVGFIPAVMRDHNVERAAVGQSVRSFVAPAATASDISPAMTVPAASDQPIGNVAMTISKSRGVGFRWTGEEQRGLNSGAGYANIRVAQIAQAMRTLVNEIETDLGALAVSASRGYGTPGTTPFASNLSDPAQVRKILSDNGSPLSDLQLVIDTAAGANMRTLANLTKANEAGGTDMLRRGVLLDVHGFAIRESAKVRSYTKGTGASYLSNGAHSVGATAIAVDTGSGTVLAGDTVTFAGDANKYVVATALAAGVVTIAAPGLRQSLADNVAMTVGNSATQNLAFARTALALATRAPALPDEGDLAIDRTMIVDPASGLGLEVSMYPGYRMIQYEVAVAWGVQCFKPEHTALLLG
jgi:hypothetical protein